jgi:mitochondrial fission protein ELM1
MCIGTRRYARLAKTFCRKLENHFHALAVVHLLQLFCGFTNRLKSQPQRAPELWITCGMGKISLLAGMQETHQQAWAVQNSG